MSRAVLPRHRTAPGGVGGAVEGRGHVRRPQGAARGRRATKGHTRLEPDARGLGASWALKVEGCLRGLLGQGGRTPFLGGFASLLPTATESLASPSRASETRSRTGSLRRLSLGPWPSVQRELILKFASATPMNGEHRVRAWRKRGLTCRRTRDRKPCRANRHGAIVSKHDHSTWHVPLHIAAVLTSWGGSRDWNVPRSRCQVLCSRRRNSDHASHSVHVPPMCRGCQRWEPARTLHVRC